MEMLWFELQRYAVPLGICVVWVLGGCIFLVRETLAERRVIRRLAEPVDPWDHIDMLAVSQAVVTYVWGLPAGDGAVHRRTGLVPAASRGPAPPATGLSPRRGCPRRPRRAPGPAPIRPRA